MRRLSATLLLSLLFALPAMAATFSVNDLGDAVDANPGNTTCATAGAVCTLRAAIEEANALAGTDTITFAVAGLIQPATAYSITSQVVIDGTSAPGYVAGAYAAPMVEIDGTNVGGGSGFVFDAGSDNSSIRGLRIEGYSTTGIQLNASSITVALNHIGPDQGPPNNVGLTIGAATTGHVIGGVDGQGNVISNNTTAGIQAGGSGYSITDNYIGVNPAGTQPRPNQTGILVQNGSSITIGGAGTLANLISGNTQTGVDITSGTGNTIAGNLIGTDVTGALAIGNGTGISIQSDNNVVGTTTASNTISGNMTDGISIVAAAGTIVRNNTIGLDSAGTTGLGNGSAGILLLSASNFDVGGLAANEGNVISFNGSDGITAGTVSNGRIYGNTIGLNAARDDSRGNGLAGIAISTGTNITIGNTGLGRNYISGNSFGGMFIGGDTGYTIQYNYIGTDGTGNVAQGNLGTGVAIGGTTLSTVQNNVISANAGHGIEVTLSSAAINIHSNLIGVGADGTTALGNMSDGVNVCDGAFDNVVGAPLTPNTIMNNGASGIGVEPTALANNRFAGNSIDNNTGLGIDLLRDGPTANDPQDEDNGPNLRQNWPLFVAAVSTATASTIRGQINTRPNELVTLHFYSSPAADPTGYGEGRTYRGTMNVTTDAFGDAPFVFTGPAIPLSHEVTATATGLTSSSGTSEFALTTPIEAPPALAFELAAYNIIESGGAASIKVVRSGQLAVTSTVQYTTSNGTATAADYTTSSGTLTFAPGETEQFITVTITNDAMDEPNETINVTLSNPAAATITPPATVQLTINDDDAPPTLLITDVALAEGNAGTTNFVFTVSVSTSSAFQVEFDYATANGTATATVAGLDYAATNGHGIIAPNGASTTITVPVTGDTTFENNETFFVDLTNPVNASFGDNQGLGTINNDDGVPTLIISDVTLNEGNAGTTAFTFTITQSAPSDSNTTINYSTADSSAVAPGDYTAVAGGVATILANATSTTITITILGDTLFEGNETFFVNLTGASGAAIVDNQGLGTITNDDGVPTLIINDVTLAEGNAGTTAFTFTITQSALSASNTTVNYATADNTAAAPGDYTATGGIATIPANNLSTTVTVNVNGDVLFEAAESFFVNLSGASGAAISDGQGVGTITNDDAGSANLSLSMTAGTSTFTPGQQVTYTITVTNAGPTSATAVTVTDVLPANLTFVSATPSQGSCTGTTTVVCTLGTLGNAASATISLVVTANGTQSITNTASATAAEVDPVPANNTASAVIDPANAIPTASEWGLLLLLMALALLAVRRL